MPQPPNLQKMLAEAQAMLAQQQEAQEALKSETVDASTGGGTVKIVMSGDLRVQTLEIDPDAVDPEDVEMLQDLIIAALNEAIRKAEELQQSRLGGAEQGGFDPMSALESLGLGGMAGSLRTAIALGAPAWPALVFAALSFGAWLTVGWLPPLHRAKSQPHASRDGSSTPALTGSAASISGCCSSSSSASGCRTSS